MKALTLGSIALLAISLAPRAAAAQGCAGGQVASNATGWHCCWPGQAWEPQQRACIGPPACPAGLVAHGESCVAAAPAFAPSARPAFQPMQPGLPGAGAQPAVNVLTVPRGALAWPSSPMAPTADVNPRFERAAGDPDLTISGATLLGLGYVTAVLAGSAFLAIGPGIYNGIPDGTRDKTCDQTRDALTLFPVLGPVLAMIAYGTCSVPEYEAVYDSNGRAIGVVPTGGRRALSSSEGGISFSWTVPTAIVQLTGLGLLIGGLTGSHSAFRVGGEPGAPTARITVQPYAPGAEGGLSLRVDF